MFKKSGKNSYRISSLARFCAPHVLKAFTPVLESSPPRSSRLFLSSFLNTHLKEEKGGLLAYVLMILAVLMVFLPVILTMTSTTQLTDIRREQEMRVNQLTVSGMQTFINLASKDARSAFLQEKTINIITPEGDEITFYKFAVPYGTVVDENTDPNIYISDPNNDGLEMSDKYRAVVKTTIGDPSEPRFFFQKLLSYDVDYTAGAPTESPLIDPTLVAGMTTVSGYTVAGASIKVMNGNGNILGTTTADASGYFTVSVRALIEGETIMVTATDVTNGLGESLPSSMVVRAAANDGSDPDVDDDGYVKIIDEEGNTTLEPFQDVRTTEDNMVVTNRIGDNGTYTTTGEINLSADQNLTLQNNVDITTTDSFTLTAGQDLVLEESVSITTGGQTYLTAGGNVTIEDFSSIQTDGNGNDSELVINSIGGNVTINNVGLTNYETSRHAVINITASGDVYLDDAVIQAVREITIEAGGSIYARRATITNEQNTANTILRLTSASIGRIYIDGLYFNKNGSAQKGTAQNDAIVCGSLRVDDPNTPSINERSIGTLNGIRVFSCN